MRFAWVVSALIALLMKGAQGWSHPRELTVVKRNLLVGTLQYRPRTRDLRRQLAAYQGERTIAHSLGEYLMSVNVNGYTISAIIDTGSGINQVACTGVKSDPASTPITVYNPTAAKPPFNLTKTGTPICNTVCTLASDGCVTPVVPNACEYKYSYADNSFVVGRMYAGVMTFPVPLTSPALKVSPFYFGCSYKASTNPYFYSGVSALFGMDWESTSFWNQLITAKVVKDGTMYMCMGNGGDGFKTDQKGVIVFGTDTAVSVRNSSVGGEVITVTMTNPKIRTDLSPPSMWVSLTGLSLGKTVLKIGAASDYLIDSGTSAVSLAAKDFDVLDAVFCTMVYNILQVTNCSDTDSATNGYTVTMLKKYTPAQLDTILPNITFTVKTGSRPVVFKPSQYMIYVEDLDYLVQITRNDENQGLLGNAWMTGWLFQQNQANLQLKMTRVKTCNDITY